MSNGVWKGFCQDTLSIFDVHLKKNILKKLMENKEKSQ